MYCSVNVLWLPQGVMGRSVVCDCGIASSYSPTFWWEIILTTLNFNFIENKRNDFHTGINS